MSVGGTGRRPAAWVALAAAAAALAGAPGPARAGAHPCHCVPCMDLDCDVLGICGIPVPEGVACDDGDPCTYGEQCRDGGGGGAFRACAGGVSYRCETPPGPCDVVPGQCLGDGRCFYRSGCLADPGRCKLAAVCDAGACQLTLADAGTACDDRNPCTHGDACDPAGECRGTPHPCKPNTPCRSTACFPDGGCRQQDFADGLACSNGDPCTVGEVCLAGECVGGRPLECPISGCQRDGGCEPGYGCTYEYHPSGTACDALGSAGVCRSGVCFRVETEDAGEVDGGEGPGTGACGCASGALLVPLAVLLSLVAIRRRRQEAPRPSRAGEMLHLVTGSGRRRRDRSLNRAGEGPLCR
jgi:hypothetical protein